MNGVEREFMPAADRLSWPMPVTIRLTGFLWCTRRRVATAQDGGMRWEAGGNGYQVGTSETKAWRLAGAAGDGWDYPGQSDLTRRGFFPTADDPMEVSEGDDDSKQHVANSEGRDGAGLECRDLVVSNALHR